MPTHEYTELSRRIDEIAEVQNALLRILRRAARGCAPDPRGGQQRQKGGASG
jgi:hypothetical protein